MAEEDLANYLDDLRLRDFPAYALMTLLLILAVGALRMFREEDFSRLHQATIVAAAIVGVAVGFQYSPPIIADTPFVRAIVPLSLGGFFGMVAEIGIVSYWLQTE